MSKSEKFIMAVIGVIVLLGILWYGFYTMFYERPKFWIDYETDAEDTIILITIENMYELTPDEYLKVVNDAFLRLKEDYQLLKIRGIIGRQIWLIVRVKAKKSSTDTSYFYEPVFKTS